MSDLRLVAARRSGLGADHNGKKVIARINILLKDPINAPQLIPCMHALEDGFWLGRSKTNPEDVWPNTYMRLDQIPKYWLCALLVKLSCKLTVEVLEKATRFSKPNFRTLCEFVFGLRFNVKLPAAAKNKHELELVLASYFKELGHRTTGD